MQQGCSRLERGRTGACRDSPTLVGSEQDLDGGWSRHPPLSFFLHLGHQQTVLELHGLTQICPVSSSLLLLQAKPWPGLSPQVPKKWHF